MSEAVQTKYAGFWWRFLAYFIDGLIIGVAQFVLAMVIIFPLAMTGSDEVATAGQLILNLLLIVATWLYFALMESSAKQATVGKMACGLIVTDTNGQRIGFGRATGRYFGKIVSTFILMIGFIMAGFTQKKQALHDMMAGTLVLKKVGTVQVTDASEAPAFEDAESAPAPAVERVTDTPPSGTRGGGFGNKED